MALSDYEVSETETVIVNDVNGNTIVGDDGKQMTIEIYSPGSSNFARAVAKKNAKVLDKLRKKGKADADEEKDLIDNANFLADCTKSVSDNFALWFPKKEGRALVVAVYSHRKIGYIKDQVAEQLEEWSNFTKDSTKS